MSKQSSLYSFMNLPIVPIPWHLFHSDVRQKLLRNLYKTGAGERISDNWQSVEES